MRRRIIIFAGIGAAAICLAVLWWQYGGGLSEQTAYNVAQEYAETYAKRNGLDLTKYHAPGLTGQSGERLYIFSWTPNGGGEPLTLSVDSRSAEVNTIESPEPSEPGQLK